MKSGYKIITLSFIFGLFVCVVDALIDYHIFYEETFWWVLFPEVGSFELYIRLLILVSFTIFGIIISRIMAKRTQTEEALQESEQKYKILTKSSLTGIFTHQDGKYVFVNDRFAQMHGYKPEELLGKDPLSLIHPDEAGDFKEIMSKRLNGDAIPEQYEVQRLTKDGKTIWCEMMATVIDYEGRPAIMGNLVDINERKRAEEKLQQRTHDFGERVKELNCLYGISNLVQMGTSLEEILNGTVDLIPPSWQYPEITCARITLEDQEFLTETFKETVWKQVSDIIMHGEPIGSVEVYYMEEKPERDKGPFLKDEASLINAIAERLGKVIEHKRMEVTLERSRKTLLAEHKQRKLLSKQLITLLEAERRRVAMELHDHIGQTLTALKMDLEMLPSKLKATDPDVKDIIQSAEDKATQAMGDLRQIAHRLRPSALDDLGLISALHVCFDDIKQRTDMEINFFRKNIPKRIEPEKEEAIYRIIQEALINVVKHANAKKVFVNLIKEEKSITLGVEDDGVGFDVSEVMKVSKKSGSLGLLIMKERAVQADGEFSVESQINGGTHLFARIPWR